MVKRPPMHNIYYILLISLIICNAQFSPAIASQKYVPGEVLIKLKDNTIQSQSIQNEDYLAKKYHVKKAKQIPLQKNIKTLSLKNKKIYKLTLNEGAAVDEFIKSFKNDPLLEAVEPNYYLSLPYDKNTMLNGAVKSASISPVYGNRTLVAVLDTGVDKGHDLIKPFLYINTPEDLNNNSILDAGDSNGKDDDGNGFVDDVIGYDFSESISPIREDNDTTDGDGHGTHVTGIIINNGSLNSQGYVKILPVKIFDSAGNSTVESAIKAIDYAASQGAKIINCSWGTNSNSSILEEAIEEAINSNVLIIAAAGNEDSPTIYYPGAYNEVITVAALNDNNTRFSLSCYGAHIDIAAPGRHILSSWPNNQYTYLSGTSMSTAAVSGILGILIYKNQSLTADQLKNITYQTADDIIDPNSNGSSLIGKDIYTGYGAINLEKALAQIDSTLPPNINAQNSNEPNITNLLNYPNPASTSTTFGFNLSENTNVDIYIYNLNGELINKLSLTGSNSSYNKISWDLKDVMGREMGNDIYIYVAKAYNSSGQTSTKKGKLAILR